MELNLRCGPTIVLPPPIHIPCETSQCWSSKMTTTQIPSMRQIPGAHNSNVWSYVNQYIMKLMFAHYVNLVLRRQTFVSPTLITPSNHQKHRKDTKGNHTNFVAISYMYLWEQVEICNMLHDSQKNFLFLMIFHCNSKPRWQRQQMKFWEGKKCRCWYRLRFWYLHSLIVLKQAGMRVELNLGSLGYNAPCQHNIRKKWQFKTSLLEW
jgi:hypothetical protein